MKVCACGCGQPVSVATYTIRSKGIIKGQSLRYCNGHTSRTSAKRAREASMEQVNPTSLCMCGCGQRAPLASMTRYDRGQVKGQPVRFINGHNRYRHTEECKERLRRASTGRVPSEETRRKISESKRGDRNPAWRGGTTKLKKHRLVYVGHDHPMAYRTGYVLEHRLVLARLLGRPLETHEHVHHIDLDSLNNAPENLIIVTPSQHSRIHRMIDWHGVEPREALARILERVEAAA